MKKNHLLKILSSLIVKFTDVQAENFYFQVKFINCYLIISFTKKIVIRDWGQSICTLEASFTKKLKTLGSQIRLEQSGRDP